MKRITILTSLLLLLNAAPLFAVSEIQGFHLGDSVRASCNSGAILLIKGTVSCITETNVTINTRQANFTIARDQVTLRPVVKFADSVLTNRPQATSEEVIAQEPGTTNEFQGFKVGERVHATCAGRALSINATLTTINQSTITLTTPMDRYTLTKDKVLLTPTGNNGIKSRSATAAGMDVPSLRAAASTVPSALEAQRAAIGQSILGKYKSAPGYGAANDYYNQTMNGVIGGQVSVNDLAGQAIKTLAELDKYGPERAENSEYESYIDLLRQFVTRAQAGEKIEGVALP